MCPDCGKPAYVGLNVVECSNSMCRHYVGPKPEPELDWNPASWTITHSSQSGKWTCVNQSRGVTLWVSQIGAPLTRADVEAEIRRAMEHINL